MMRMIVLNTVLCEFVLICTNFVFQILYARAVSRGLLPKLPGAGVLLYCFSTALLFHAAIWEPQNLRPSYWDFLHGISGGRFVFRFE